MSSSVTADNLVKSFSANRALDRISFDVRPGELFGFIGPDGGGKTTLFRILVTLLLPDPGQFLYSYVRKEAVLSSQIEGNQSSLSELLLF